MALTQDKVESLVEEDEGISDALEAIYRASDNGTVEWADVNDHVSSGHWGRLIEQGVLVDDGDGFRIADREAVESVLTGVDGGDVTPAEEEIEDEGWSQWDKLAALGSLGLFAGYSIPQVRDLIGGSIDLLLGPMNELVPFHVVVLLIAVVTGIVTTIVQGSLMDPEKMGKYQDRMKEIQNRREKAKERGDDEALEQIQQEQMAAMGDQVGMIKEQFRPTVWIMLVTIPFFLWIYWNVLDGHLAAADQTIVTPLLGEVSWSTGVLGPMQMWIIWYFLCSMSFSNIIRKALDINISPTG
ncbi:MAG: DUF106 domain-containing protein [Halobacteriales archaeon]